MNSKEKEQVIRMIKATAERRKDTDSVKLAEELANGQLKKLKESSKYKELIEEYKESERVIRFYENKKSKAKKQIEKFAEKLNCSCGCYSGVEIRTDEHHFRQIIDRNITDKTEELVLKVLSSGSSKEAMSFVVELRDMKLY